VDGDTEVSAVDPVASMQAVQNQDLDAVAGEVRDLLRDALDTA
jgi:ABC-type proline/glycine betaine transport system substrate-binding protein